MFGIEVQRDLGGNLLTPFLWIGAFFLCFFFMWVYDQLWGDISIMPFGIIGFFGNQGRGKTFTAVTYARRWRKKHPHSPVYTNMFKLELPGDGPVYIACDLDKMMEAQDSLILIDEAGVFVNAWEWMGGAQRQFAQFAAGTRHFGNLILCTAHTPEQLNIRMQKVLAELHFLESFQGVKLFRSYVYESFAGMKKANRTKTVWVPKWPTTCRSYDTQMLREHLRELQRKTDMTEGELASVAGLYDSNGNIISDDNSSVGVGLETTTKGRARKGVKKTANNENTSSQQSSSTSSQPQHVHNADCAEWRVVLRHQKRELERIQAKTELLRKRNIGLAMFDKVSKKAS